MKRTVSGVVGGKTFTIEEDAWAELEGYLDSLRLRYRNEPTQLEVVSDIEDRIAEYLWEWKGAQGQVIQLDDIIRVEKIMGFSDKSQGGQSKGYSGNVQGPRKLFRDPDRRVIGGVCSGLAYYFDMSVVAVRVITLILVIFIGVSFWVYLILWIAIPKAVTRVQKLQMRGIAVTPESLNQGF